MRAIEVARFGGPEVLTPVELPAPEPGPGELLVRTDAVGVNYIDTYFRTGLYPPGVAVHSRIRGHRTGRRGR